MGWPSGENNDHLLNRPLLRTPSALGSRESLATLSELDLGAERDVRVWPLHPSLLEEPHCFQVNADDSPSDPDPLGAALVLNPGSSSPTGNLGGREPLLFMSLRH